MDNQEGIFLIIFVLFQFQPSSPGPFSQWEKGRFSRNLRSWSTKVDQDLKFLVYSQPDGWKNGRGYPASMAKPMLNR